MGHTAFVLSGGGAKGAFSAGALRYLLQEQKVFPDVITGTSAGSICAAVIAQARSADEFFSMAAVLCDDIVRMSVPGAAFVPQPWLAGLEGTPLGDDILSVLRGKTRPTIPPDPSLDTDPLADVATPEFTLRQGWDDLRSLVTHVAKNRHALKDFPTHNQSLLLIDPMADAFTGESPGTGPSPIDQKLIAAPGLTLRIPVTALGAGCTRYVTESGALVERDGSTPAPDSPTPGVIEAVLASSSVPGVFAPRAIGDDVYVDGGVLENIPMPAALSVGAQECYVILADPLACPPPPMDYGTADLLDVVVRAESTVAFYDQQRRDLVGAREHGVSVHLIDPTVTVVSSFETEAGLLTIDMDYGWLRACGETAAGAHTARAHVLADQIATGRLRAWYLRAGIGGEGTAVDTALSSATTMVSGAMSEWSDLGLTLPEGSDSWATPENAPSADT